jgi:hypothetical protein
MSDYVKSTNFAIKDSLVTTDPAKVIKGTDIDNEYNAIANAVASKANTNSPALTGTPTAPTATVGSNTTQLATTAFVKGALDAQGLGTMSIQNKTAVDITGGTITGITDLTVADGGTGASSITANSVVLGNGTSPLNGNLVAPSTSGNILTSNGSTWASAAPNYIGVNQTWNNVTSSRAFNTTYTNSTGRPIEVGIYMNNTTNAGSRCYFTVNSIIVTGTGGSYGGQGLGLTVIVPDGATYSLVLDGGSIGISNWAELY